MTDGNEAENQEGLAGAQAPQPKEPSRLNEGTRQLSKQASKAALAAVKKWLAGVVVSVGWPILIIGAIIIALIIIGGFLLLGLSSSDDPRQGTTQTQEATDTDVIREVLAKAGNTDAFRQLIIAKTPEIISRLDEITFQINKLPNDKKNKVEYQSLVKQINETKPQILGLITNVSSKEIQKIIQGLTTIGQQSATLLAPAGADFSHLLDAPIEKILVIKNRNDKSQRRIYFLDKDGKKLGSAPINIGSNLKKTAGFSRGDKATPIGNYKISEKRDKGGKILYARKRPGVVLGYYALDIGVPGRGILIHGSAPQKDDRLYPTDGCIRMYNSHIAYIYPLIKKGTEIEIQE